MITKRIGVIPDIHEKQYITERILDRLWNEYQVDEIVMLGDYFDKFERMSDPQLVEYFVWLEKIFRNKQIIPLLGNHDIHYLTNVRNYCCSGFDPRKVNIMDEVFGKNGCNFPKRFMYSLQVRDEEVMVLSHAGVHTGMFGPFDDITKVETFDRLNDSMVEKFTLSEYDFRIGPGRSRGGWETKGGVVWQDWNKDFLPIDGVHQIVGHTRRDKEFRYKNTHKSINLCLDSDLHHFAIIEPDNKFEFDIIVKGI